jgi:hypothetical protein
METETTASSRAEEAWRYERLDARRNCEAVSEGFI